MALIFYPTHVHPGLGAVNELKSKCARVGVRRPMIVTDKGMVAAGLAQRTIGTTGGLPVMMLDETLSNPAKAMVLRATVQYRDAGCDGLIVVGGSSSIDLAKGIVIVAIHPGLLITYVTIEGGNTKTTEAAAPLITTPTTTGTGSEVARGVIIIPGDDRKLGPHPWHLLSKSAIYNVELTLDLPPALTAATDMDTVACRIETFLTPALNPFVDGIALDGLERAWANIERTTCDGTDRDAWLNVTNASV